MGDMEDHMNVLAVNMSKDLEKAVNRRGLKIALEVVQLALSICGGSISFKGASPFGVAAAIFYGAKKVFLHSLEN